MLSVHPSVHPSVCHFKIPLSNFVYTISEEPASPSYTERSSIFEQTEPKLAQSRVVIYSNFGYLNWIAFIPGGRVVLGHSNYISPLKKNQEFQTPQKIFEILAAQKYHTFSSLA